MYKYQKTKFWRLTMSDVSIEKAEVYFKAQENIKALSVLKILIENDPNDIAALMMSALIYKNLAKFSKAIKLLNKIVVLKPDHTGALFNLGLNYSIIEENDRAIEIYSELFKTNPELTELPMKLAALYNKTMQYDKAVECIEKYLDYAPSDSIAWLELGFSYKKKNDLKSFKEAFIKAHELEFDTIYKQNQNKELSYGITISVKKKSKFSQVWEFCIIPGIIIFGLTLYWPYFIGSIPTIGIPIYIVIIASLVCVIIRRISANNEEKKKARIELETSHEKIDRWQKIIEFHRDSKNHEKLIKLCEFALLIFPSKDDLYFSLGKAYVNKKLYSKAIEAFKKGIEIKADNVSLINFLGRAYFRDENYAKAELTLESAIAIAPDNLQSLLTYGRILYKNKNYEDSSKILTKALTLLNEEMKRLLWKLPKIKFPVKNSSIRKFSFKYTEDLDSKYNKLSNYIRIKIEISYILGLAFLNIGEFDRIEELVKDSLSVMENAPAYNLLIFYHYYLEDYQKSLEACYKSLDIDENQEEIKGLLPHLYFESGDTGKALDTSKLLLQKYPDAELIWNELGYIYSKTGEYEKAADALGKALQINYKHANPWNHLGYIEYKRGNYEKALNLIKKSIKKNPDYARAHYYLAKVLFSQGKVDEALVSCNECLKISPNFKDAYVLRDRIMN